MTEMDFDAVVVGSGFGGSVSACRLAEAGLNVCLLERGKSFPPGSFPRTPLGIKHNLWDPSEGLQGMFDFWSFQGIDALVSSGLGGGSLIYANVMLRKDERWFVREDVRADGYEYWPVTRADLDPHYDRVAKRMAVQRYPLEQPPYDATRKTVAFRDAARRLGLDWFLPELAVTFANEGDAAVPGDPIREAAPNIHGRSRSTCRLCGECDVGCNYGSKNTLDYTYISDAWRAGADIRTRCEVRSFEPLSGAGYAVHYVRHEDGEEGRPTNTAALPLHTLHTPRLILSCGTLGTTFLLLKNRGAFPGLSTQLGAHFSGNGDLLTFAVECSDTVDRRKTPRVIDSAYGPVITSAVRIPDTLDGGDGRGFYIEDAGNPAFASWLLELVDEPRALAEAAPQLIKQTLQRIGHRRTTAIGGEIAELLGDCDLSSGLLPLLGMGRDIPDGRMVLEGAQLDVDWRKEGSSAAYYDRVRDMSRRLTEQLGGRFVDNPIWLLNRVITVHALGGAPMGRTPAEGVVNPFGEVFGYPGLHVADGSVMPGPVGANPSMTIAALADRFADAILEGCSQGDASASRASGAARSRGAAKGASANGATAADASSSGAPAGVDFSAQAGPAPAPRGPDGVSLAFTEEMKGFVTIGETDFDRGFRQGRNSSATLMFRLTITAQDVERFLAERGHEALASGYVEADVLGGRLPVQSGLFNLFVDQHGNIQDKRMLYRLKFSDSAGHPLTLTGYKVVKAGHGYHVWHDTSTLFTRILTGHVDPDDDDRAEILASGLLHILPLDFARQMTTFRVTPPGRLDALGKFGAAFAGDLWQVYRPGRGGEDAS